MPQPPSGKLRPEPRDLPRLGLVLGMTSGLIEGVGHLALQRLGILDNSWYPIIWIAAVVNGALLGLAGMALAALVRTTPHRDRLGSAAVFLLVAGACVPVLALMLKEWLHVYAIVSLTLGLSAATSRWLLSRPASLVWRRAGALTAFAATTLVLVSIEGGARLSEWRLTRALPTASASAPDILLVVIDALRADHLSSQGYHRDTSPTLDRIASEGVLFEDAYSTTSYTLPSHTSLLTGLFPYEHGVEWQTSKVQATASYPTLPEVLQEYGYRTAAFSANTFWFTREHGFGRGFIHFDDFFHSVPDMLVRTAYGQIAVRLLLGKFGWNDIPARRRAPSINDDALAWLERDRSKPAFVMLNYMDVHDPYVPPQPYRSRFSDLDAPGGLLHWLIRVPATLTPAQRQSEIDAYDGAIAYLDDQLGSLLAALGRRNTGRDLLLVVTSDHGEEFGEHGTYLHAHHLYRETIHVPLIVWAPGRVPAGRRVPTPVSNASIPATVMQQIDAGDESFPGPDLSLMWRTDEPPADWPLPLAELTHRPWAPTGTPVSTGSLRSLVSADYHFLEHSVAGPELYERSTDPSERWNRARDAALASTVRTFRERLQRLTRSSSGRR